jgi:hypothetical protein
MYETFANGSDKLIVRTLGTYTRVQCPSHVLVTFVTPGCGVYIKGADGEQVFQMIIEILATVDNYAGPIYVDQVGWPEVLSEMCKLSVGRHDIKIEKVCRHTRGGHEIQTATVVLCRRVLVRHWPVGKVSSRAVGEHRATVSGRSGKGIDGKLLPYLFAVKCDHTETTHRSSACGHAQDPSGDTEKSREQTSNYGLRTSDGMHANTVSICQMHGEKRVEKCFRSIPIYRAVYFRSARANSRYSPHTLKFLLIWSTSSTTAHL